MAVTRIAILGAGGFVGNRAVEMFHLGGRRQVVPVVHRAAALALASRFELEGRVANALDEVAMARALSGCDAVVAAVAGPPATIVGMIAPLAKAAERAEVRRIVYLSSQMVHGYAPEPGTVEGSPFPRARQTAYSRAKIAAERTLRVASAAAGIECVILRPGIVYGPRSRWTGGIADDLLAGDAFLLSGAAGVCNAVYVDNLVGAIDLAIDHPEAAGAALFVNDAEALNWADLVEPIAAALGIERDAIARPTLAEALASGPSWTQRKVIPPAKRAFRLLPRGLAHSLRKVRPSAPAQADPPQPHFSHEMALLQSSSVRLLGNGQAERLLGYRPAVAHRDAMRRSLAWLRFAGYPVA
ncbi:MAG: NAD-dependent epimerase/dehydratase family protein [Sphingomicrobium sp.]